MRRSNVLKGIVIVCSFFLNKAHAQSDQTLQELGLLINDAIFFTDKYVTPATDAAVYQAAAAWVNTPQKAELWDFTLGIHMNTFFVPQSDRTFRLSNSDLSFFTIENETSALTPTTLGSDQYVTLIGSLDGSEVLLKSPEGINRETVVYPYLQGSLGLPFGTELIAKYSPKIVLKNVDYQVYGIGLKHNLSQYFQKLESKKIYFSVMAAYAKEDLTVNFLDVETSYGNLGLNALNSLINTWQFQLNGSKDFGKFELSAGLIVNTSNFEYKVAGRKGEIEEIIPLQSILNTELKSIADTKFNCIGEIAGRWEFKRFYIQPNIAFGKFVNTNIALQYKFK